MFSMSLLCIENDVVEPNLEFACLSLVRERLMLFMDFVAVEDNQKVVVGFNGGVKKDREFPCHIWVKIKIALRVLKGSPKGMTGT